MMKLVAVASLSSPIWKPSPRAPMPWALSSITKQLVFVGDFADGLHVRALAVKMDRHDGLGLAA